MWGLLWDFPSYSPLPAPTNLELTGAWREVAESSQAPPYPPPKREPMAVGGAATAAAVDIGQTSPVPDGCRGSPSAGGLWLGGISWEGERGRGQQCVREHGEHGIGHGGEGGKEGA